MHDERLSRGLRALAASYRRQCILQKLVESFENPTYDEIKNAYRPAPGSDAATTKINPTVDFMKRAYSVFNKEFFGGRLPEDIELQVVVDPGKTSFGSATYSCDGKTVTPRAIILNNRYQMTFHDWLDVLLHECVHVAEYVMNPEPFLRRYRGGRYDAHGPWFLYMASGFDNYGFNVKRYCTAAIGTYGLNLDDERVSKLASRQSSQYVVVRVVGLSPEHGGAAVKMSRKMLPKFESIVRRGRATKGLFWQKVQKLEYYTTENPIFANMRKIVPRDEFSALRYYFWDTTEKKYGPFTADGEFIPSESDDDGKSEEKRFLESVNRERLAEKVFRSIVGRKFKDWSYDTRKSLKYIKPFIKNPDGYSIDCIVSEYPDANSLGRLAIGDNCQTIYISSQWVESMESRFSGTNGTVFDDFYLTEDYQQLRRGDDWDDEYNGMTVPEAMNHAIDNVLTNVEKDKSYSVDYLKGEVVTAVDELLLSAVGKNGVNGYVQSESVDDDVVVDGDAVGNTVMGKDMEEKEKEEFLDDYARNIAHNVKGVSDVKVGEDEVLVTID